MSNQPETSASRPEEIAGQESTVGKNRGELKAPDKESDAKTAEAKELTPEEQMALYEESLKESDWGHQPC